MSEEQRDEILLLNINKWLNNDILPQEFHNLSNWDIYETLHDENISIVQIGSTVYKTNDKNHNNDDIDDFLKESDDEEDQDDDIKQNEDNKPLNLEVVKIHQFRIVFDFGFDFDDDSKPKVLAIYHLKDEWQQIFKTKEFNDKEIDNICVNEQELDEMDKCDLSLLFKSLSKKQLINGIKSYLKKHKNNKQLIKIKELKNINGLMINDKEFLMIIIAKIIAIDGEDILDEFNKYIDNDLDQLINIQFKQNMIDLKNEINEKNFANTLNDIEQIVKKANSLNQLKQSENALDLIINVCKTFLIDFIVKNMENDNDDLIDLNITNHTKLNYRIGDLETSMEKICNGMNINNYKDKLCDLKSNLIKWKKELMPIFGPLFSDNIRALNKKLSKSRSNKLKGKRKLDDDGENKSNPNKKQKTA